MTDEKNILYLHPAMNIKMTLQTSLTYRGIELPITIVKPDAAFTVTVPQDFPNTGILHVAAINTDADDYEWLVNDKEITLKNSSGDITITDAAPPLKIELTVTYKLNDNISTDTHQVTLREIQPGTVKSKPQK